jgi:hypothetical protein
MTRGTRLFLAFVIGGAVLLLATLGAGAAAVYRGGTVAVEIVEDGNQIRVGLPAALLGVAIALTPASALEEATTEVRPFLPALEAGWRELAETPDFVLVEVVSADETVLIEKSGSRLLVSVDTPDTQIRIGVPLGTVGSLLRKLERHA